MPQLAFNNLGGEKHTLTHTHDRSVSETAGLQPMNLEIFGFVLGLDTLLA